MTTKTSKDYKRDYTKPELRERLKEEIKQSDKGGKSGQWSARKSQLLKHDYEAQGGGYRHSDTPTQAQKSLEQWSKEDWQTSDHAPAIRQGKTTRYLPKEVWDKMSESEREQANCTKESGSKSGHQYVDNPESTRQKVKDQHKKS